MYKKVVESANVNVVLNSGQEEELINMIGSINKKNICIIPNCISIDNDDLSEKENIILWCGQFSCRIKRPDAMLDIWKIIYNEFPKWKLCMVGDGEDLEEMKQYALKKGIDNVIFTGRTDSSVFFRRAKIGCVTSTQESFSLVAVEAMNHYMPIVVFNSFTMAKELIVDDVNGYLINNFDKDNFARKLRLLMADDNKRISMGNNSKKIALNYHPEKIYQYWRNFVIQK